MIAGGNKQPRLNEGLDLLPRAIVDQHFSQRSRKDRLAKAVSKHPERIGIGIDEGTGLLITRQSAEVIGRGAVYVMRSLLEVIPDDDDDTLDHLSHCDHRCFEADRRSRSTGCHCSRIDALILRNWVRSLASALRNHLPGPRVDPHLATPDDWIGRCIFCGASAYCS